MFFGVLITVKEKNRACARIIKHCHAPKTFINNIKLRDHSTMPKVDMYVAGPPCTKYSALGKQEGTCHEDGRLYEHCLEYIAEKKPILVIIENVKNLHVRFKEIADHMMKTIETVGYDVDYHILDTANFGLPHRRSRWYLVAIRSDHCRRNAGGVPHWPSPYPSVIPLDAIITPLPEGQWRPHPDNDLGKKNVLNAYAKVVADGANPFLNHVIVDVGSSEEYSYHLVEKCPTLTRARAGSFGYWDSKKGGTLDLQEMCLLQGFNLSDIDYKGAGVTEKQVAAAVGNMMSVNVLMSLFPLALYRAKLITRDMLRAMQDRQD
jgi:DNA (cytosine-5)-methyltransferase 1